MSKTLLVVLNWLFYTTYSWHSQRTGLKSLERKLGDSASPAGTTQNPTIRLQVIQQYGYEGAKLCGQPVSNNYCGSTLIELFRFKRRDDRHVNGSRLTCWPTQITLKMEYRNAIKSVMFCLIYPVLYLRGLFVDSRRQPSQIVVNWHGFGEMIALKFFHAHVAKQVCSTFVLHTFCNAFHIQ